MIKIRRHLHKIKTMYGYTKHQAADLDDFDPQFVCVSLTWNLWFLIRIKKIKIEGSLVLEIGNWIIFCVLFEEMIIKNANNII